MLFLNADFWPLFWSVIGGGAAVSGLLSLFVANTARAHRAPVPVPVEVPARRTREPARTGEPARRAA